MKVNIFDVAKKSGLSVVTVSRVINNAGTVREKNRLKVLSAMKELGYSPSAAARSLARGKTGVIGIAIMTLNDSFLDAVVKEINDKLAEHRYLLALFISPEEETDDDLHNVIFQEDRVDGMIILSPINEARYEAELDRKNIPYVLVDNQQEHAKAPSIQVDNYHGGYEATRHLIELGHVSIAHICGPSSFLSSKERVLGYKAAMMEAGLQPRIEQGNFDIPSGYDIAMRWIESGDLPSAVFAGDDMMAFGVMDALKNNGLRIPRDMSVIGYDDQVFATELRPWLTTVRQPVEQIGAKAIELLLGQIDGAQSGNPVQHIKLRPELLVRESTSKPQPAGSE